MPPAPALQVAGLAKVYGRTVALRGVNLELDSGHVLALLGANGSGKTTLLKIIAGITAPTVGSVRVSGRDIRRESAFARTQIGLLAGETYLYDDLTALENLRFTLTMAGRERAGQRIEGALARVGLGSHGRERVRTFSSGMKRRLAVARVQLLEPRVLLLDEPYNSLDASGAAMVDEWVRTLTRQEGGCAVIASHDTERVTAIADAVARLEHGSLTLERPVRQIRGTSALTLG